MDKTWKRRERQVAHDFGTDRNPLSGSNSRHSGSDTLHAALFIEAKTRAAHAACRLYDETAIRAKLEQKIPVVALFQNYRNGYLLVIDPRHLKQIAEVYLGGKC